MSPMLGIRAVETALMNQGEKEYMPARYPAKQV